MSLEPKPVDASAKQAADAKASLLLRKAESSYAFPVLDSVGNQFARSLRDLIRALGAPTVQVEREATVQMRFADWCQAVSPGLFWRYLYDTQFGLINCFLGLLHLPQPNWLGDYTIALWSVVLFDVWQWTPFVALIALAGLQALPKEPFPSFVDGRVELLDLMVDTAPYVAHGALVDGVLSRLGTAALLNVTAGGGSQTPTFVVEKR